VHRVDFTILFHLQQVDDVSLTLFSNLHYKHERIHTRTQARKRTHAQFQPSAASVAARNLQFYYIILIYIYKNNVIKLYIYIRIM
jgi:hypothetical protein